MAIGPTSSTSSSPSSPADTQTRQRSALVLDRTKDLFSDLASNATSQTLLRHFSHLPEIYVQHAPDTSRFPSFWKVTTRNGVRSYFDIVAAQFVRRDVSVQSAMYYPATQEAQERVVLRTCTEWMWRGSNESFREEQTCTLHFDEAGQIVGLAIGTRGTPETCVMLAMDKHSSDYRLK